jgi:beta-glucanase (GH16 family)
VRLNNGSQDALFNYYSCVFATNDNINQYDYFVPQASALEFTSFLNNAPLGVSFANCVMPITYTAKPTVSDTSFSIFSEGGAITPIGTSTIPPITNIMVPTNQSITDGIMPVPNKTVVSVVNQSGMQPIEFYYTRHDCVGDPSTSPPLCNTWIVKEVQTITFTAPPTAPVGINSSWISASAPPVVNSTYFIGSNINGPWTPVTWFGKPSGPPGIYNNDYHPPSVGSCPNTTPVISVPVAGGLNLTGYHLTFDDEFNSFTSSPNGLAGWDTTIFGASKSVGKRFIGAQEYDSDSSVGVNPFSVGGCVLTITAAPGSNPDGREYNSGIITTDGDFSQAYGYFEMRAQLPQGAGMWPAFWMYPETGYGEHELDAIEAFGAPTSDGVGQSNTYHVGMHDAELSDAELGSWVSTVPSGTVIYAGYHTYGLLWTPTTTTYYFDGHQTAQFPTPSDMNAPMYMIANTSVGGSWTGFATGETGTMKIDYIRAFSNDPGDPTVPLQPISSPDGGGNNLYGAMSAN